MPYDPSNLPRSSSRPTSRAGSSSSQGGPPQHRARAMSFGQQGFPAGSGPQQIRPPSGAGSASTRYQEFQGGQGGEPRHRATTFGQQSRGGFAGTEYRGLQGGPSGARPGGVQAPILPRASSRASSPSRSSSTVPQLQRTPSAPPGMPTVAAVAAVSKEDKRACEEYKTDINKILRPLNLVLISEPCETAKSYHNRDLHGLKSYWRAEAGLPRCWKRSERDAFKALNRKKAKSYLGFTDQKDEKAALSVLYEWLCYVQKTQNQQLNR